MPIYTLMYSFSYLEPVHCSMLGSNCCFLTCIHISQETGKVVWYSHLLKNFQQFVVIHTLTGFGTINKAEVNIFLELSCFFYDPMDVSYLIFSSSKNPLNPAWIVLKSYRLFFEKRYGKLPILHLSKHNLCWHLHMFPQSFFYPYLIFTWLQFYHAHSFT